MKKIALVLAWFCCLAAMAQAGIAKYCMSYSDFVNGNWIPVEELTQGRTLQACQLKSLDNHYYFRTGDKTADKVLKKEAFAVMYGDQLFVNCRNLRNNGISLDVTGYTQAVRYDQDKVCVMAYKIDDASFLLGLGLEIASVCVDNKAAKGGLGAAAIGTMISNEFLSKTVCYLVDNDADPKGKIAVTRMNDQYMENLLCDDAPLLEQYNAIHNKRSRQSSANVLPILMEKGLVTSFATN